MQGKLGRLKCHPIINQILITFFIGERLFIIFLHNAIKHLLKHIAAYDDITFTRITKVFRQVVATLITSFLEQVHILANVATCFLWTRNKPTTFISRNSVVNVKVLRGLVIEHLCKVFLNVLLHILVIVVLFHLVTCLI